MSASKESRLKPDLDKNLENNIENIETLGIIAGGGNLPQKLLGACRKKGIKPFVVGFEDQTDRSIIEGCNHFWGSLGAAGQIIRTLKAHHVRDLVLIGSIRRPSFFELKPDFKTAEFFTRIGLRALGDSNILSLLKSELEKEGFRVHGVQNFIDDILCAEGNIGKFGPSKADSVDITRGIDVCTTLGDLDIGQACIVQEGIVLGVEAAEGTDALIKRCAHLKREGRGGVLIKLCKPNQDRDLDLPTVGPVTIQNAKEAGLNGIALHARKSLLLDPQEVAEIADKNKMFVTGIPI